METLFEFSPLVVAVIPVTVGLVQVVKSIGLPNKFAPATSIVIGIALMSLTVIPWQAIIVQGIIAGLAASGLWSSGKAIIKPD